MACEELLSEQKRLVAQGFAETHLSAYSGRRRAGARPDFPGVKLTEK